LRPKPFRFLAGVLHRQHQPVGHPGRERDAGRLAARNRIELLEPGIAQDERGAKVDERAAHARKRDEPAAIDIDRARPTRGEDEGLVGREAHGLHLEQHLGRHLGHDLAVREADALNHCPVLLMLRALRR
jgi:hypothetical protein